MARLLVSSHSYYFVMTTNRRQRTSALICPCCLEVGTLRKIIYGMPDPENFDFEKFAVGGCCMNGDGSDPDVSCRQCDWSGFRDELKDSRVQ